MCGIVGLIAKNTWGFYNPHVNLLRSMLYADTIRGADSTGVFGVTKNGNVTILKSILPGYEFIQLKEFDRFASSMLKNYTVAIGHNRKATKGEIKPENAHPFNEDHITLVHNGMMWGHDSKEFEVDSHALCADIARKGELETLREFRGAYALVWYDKQRQRICFARNNDRPLFLLEAKDAWILSSEHGIPSWLAGRENYDSIGISSIKSVTPDYIFSMELKGDKREKFKVQKVERVSTFLPPVVQHPTIPDDSLEDNRPVVALPDNKEKEEPKKPAHSNVLSVADYGSYSIVNNHEEFAKGQEIIIRPYDYNDISSSGPGNFRVFCDVMCTDGKPYPGYIAYISTYKDEIDHYVANKDSEYFKAKIMNFKVPKNPKSDLDIVIQIDMSWHTKPKPIETGMSKNQIFMCKETFNSATITGCRTCQKPLDWKELKEYDVVKDETSGQRKYRFLCKACSEKVIPIQPTELTEPEKKEANG